ncbi:hypothetical protein [Brevundimonas variabilis]|uniref:Lipoprotein n=1 Tax=Brevundimonas variabilis TaxID=74312 RepID=A0A7W9FFU3_9CAUL|nr:hypothetical protein [Brevundimonas variabilis]MBB5745903.1 hypothetical protein [Brevundimonas variabilis]
MRVVAVIAIGGLVLGACGSEPDSAAPEAPVPAMTPAAPTPPVSAVALTEASLISVCRAGLSFMHDQPVGEIRSDGVADGIMTASWRAPVDGGRRFADCRVENDTIQWRPARLPDGQTATWSNTPTDPVVRFSFEGDQIVLNQTNPDGTASQAMLPVPVQQEAAS